MNTQIARKGYINVPGGKVWYEVHGQGELTPLLVLHGGPGFPHEYLEPLAALGVGRPVVFYDQLGCGRSDRPEDSSLWTVERFVIELVEVRKHLDLSKIHLFGHSWGTMLAVDYALTWPDGLESLILSSPCISIPRWIADSKKLRKKLPEHTQVVLAAGEISGNFFDVEYQDAKEEYYRNFVCRVRPKPDGMERASEGASDAVYSYMWGPNEFVLSGTLRDYDRSDRLEDLSLPVLYTCGNYDEAMPATTEWYHRKTANSEFVVFEESSHQAHWEERELYQQTVDDYLEHVEQGIAFQTELSQEAQQSRVGIFTCLLVVGFAFVILGFVFL